MSERFGETSGDGFLEGEVPVVDLAPTAFIDARTREEKGDALTPVTSVLPSPEVTVLRNLGPIRVLPALGIEVKKEPSALATCSQEKMDDPEAEA